MARRSPYPVNQPVQSLKDANGVIGAVLSWADVGPEGELADDRIIETFAYRIAHRWSGLGEDVIDNIREGEEACETFCVYWFVVVALARRAYPTWNGPRPMRLKVITDFSGLRFRRPERMIRGSSEVEKRAMQALSRRHRMGLCPSLDWHFFPHDGPVVILRSLMTPEHAERRERALLAASFGTVAAGSARRL